ncbi:DUF1441 family protein [uncultured Marinobacter sp.]|uniref:DUF1441 family protein n=1 Tax=uncultured Marinobacter sp. TaxID=187379 RepID=UPI0030DA9776
MAEINRLEDAYSWNLTRLADAFGLHRDTIRKRLIAAGVVPAGTRSNANVYRLQDAGPAIFADSFSGAAGDPDDLPPQDRKAWYQSENERIKLEIELRQLLRAEEVHLEMSRLAKAVTTTLDSLPDILERDCSLTPEAIERVQETVDALREQMYLRIIQEDDE